MTIKSIAGIDHAVVAVKDLDAAAANWKQLGFTISPRGTHSAHMGTGNYTIMLGDDYMELLGVLTATEHNAPTRTYLEATGGGIERIAFTTPSAAAGAAEIRTLGYAAIGPTDFERPVTMPDGRKAAAKFATAIWSKSTRPASSTAGAPIPPPPSWSARSAPNAAAWWRWPSKPYNWPSTKSRCAAGGRRSP